LRREGGQRRWRLIGRVELLLVRWWLFFFVLLLVLEIVDG
jgi:hypothetical protein